MEKSLHDIENLTRDDLELILATSEQFREISERRVKKVPTLRGKTICLFFIENSTRTRISFELAAKRMSADLINFSASTSSLQKGESLTDTVKTIMAMGVDLFVIRHSAPGSSRRVEQVAGVPVINAGDGPHAHPTQALLDLFTIYRHKKKIEGLKVAIIGDIYHSRVARSNIFSLTRMGAEVVLCGPPTLIPREIEKLGVQVTYSVDEACKMADVIMCLRMQLERQQSGMFPSMREYIQLYRIDEKRVSLAKDDVIIMHPGPMNRGVEIIPEIAYHHRSVIEEQVTNGVATRMALFYLLLGRGNEETAD
ncbi:MAG: aspartate carbamoyltransferase catalytic subunit [Candidatus Wallbacteria bacterium]|nr:aspartate carbamoyltransferase catalytic subunit [Candidatus Wallbacteria bacterium]